MKTFNTYPQKAIHRADAYADLVAGLAWTSADRGLLNYYMFYSGSLDALDPHNTLSMQHAVYKQSGNDEDTQEALNRFAGYCISQNLSRNTNALLSLIRRKLKNYQRTDFGEDEVQIKTPSSTTLDLVEELLKQHPNMSHSLKGEARNTIDSLVAVLSFDANVSHTKVSAHSADFRRLFMLCDLIEAWDATVLVPDPTHGVHDYAPYRLPALRAAIFLASLITGNRLDTLRSDRLTALQSLATLDVKVSDMTLAALPEPSSEMIALCNAHGEGHLTSTGYVYLQTNAACS